MVDRTTDVNHIPSSLHQPYTTNTHTTDFNKVGHTTDFNKVHPTGPQTLNTKVRAGKGYLMDGEIFLSTMDNRQLTAINLTQFFFFLNNIATTMQMTMMMTKVLITMCKINYACVH